MLQKLILNGASVSVVAFLVRGVVDNYDSLPLLPGLPRSINGSRPFSVLGYTPSEDHLVNKCFFAALMGYLAMSAFALVLDFFPDTMARFKVQGSKWKGKRGAPTPFASFSEWLRAFGMSVFNICVSSWPFTCAIWWLWKDALPALTGRVVTSEADPFNIYVELPKLLGCFAVVDTWFYWTHRALHITRPVNIYKWVHKFHHRFKAPAAVASMYAHPLEYGFGNLSGVALGPALMNAHPYTAYFWFCFGLFATGGSHSGYTFLGAEDHDNHHEFFNYHYGVGGLWDAICGTNYIGSELWEKNQRKKEK